MADTIPLQYAQSLLRLVPIPEEQLRQQLTELNLPLVLLQDKAVADARIPVDDYGLMDLRADTRGPRDGLVDARVEPDWTDGYIGGRYTVSFAKNWKAQVYGDVGTGR